MATIKRNKKGQFVPPAGRPTVASALRASLNDKRPSSGNSSASSRNGSSTIGSKRQTTPSQTKPSQTKPRDSYLPKRQTTPRKTTPRDIQTPGATYSKPTLTKERDWSREKTYPTRSKQTLNANLEFYQNKLRSKPGGHTIEEMLKWEKNYDRLEKNHRYIQWLFPIPGSRGMNPQSQPLQEHEAEKIRSTTSLRHRVLRAYKMMLDFYGMDLVNKDTGEVKRSKNWKPRYSHLNMSFHNYLRISRILKSLGCLGYEHLQFPWLRFILEEAVINKTLPNLDCGAVSHWIKALTDEKQQREMSEFYQSIKPGKLSPKLEEEMDWELSEEEGGTSD